MTITLTTSGNNSTVTLAYTAQTTRVVDTLTAAAQYWYHPGEGDPAFSALTNNQKLKIIDDMILRTILDAAKTQNILAAQEAATITAQAENTTKFI